MTCRLVYPLRAGSRWEQTSPLNLGPNTSNAKTFARRANTKQKHWPLQQKYHVNKNIARPLIRQTKSCMQPPCGHRRAHASCVARVWGNNHVACVAWYVTHVAACWSTRIIDTAMCGEATHVHTCRTHACVCTAVMAMRLDR